MIRYFNQGGQGYKAIQFKDNAESFAEIREWVGRKFYYDYQSSPFVWLERGSTNWAVRKDDWIIHDELMGFRVYSPDDMKSAEEIK